MTSALIPFTAAAPTTIYSQAQRNAKAATWPDGSPFAPIRESNGSFTSCATGTKTGGVNTVTGTILAKGTTIDDPAGISATELSYSGLPGKFNYAGGGPQLINTNDGSRLQIMHCEQWPGGANNKYWSSLELSRNADGTSGSWTYVGTIVQLSAALSTAPPLLTPGYDIGGGNWMVLGKYVYVYYREITDYSGSSATSYISVARCLVSDLFSSSISGSVGTWKKYTGNGTWTGDPLTGTGTKLFNYPTNFAFWPATMLHAATGTIWMVFSAGSTNSADPGIYVTTSIDGLNWTTPDLIAVTGDSVTYGSLRFVDYMNEYSGGGLLDLYSAEITTFWSNVIIARRSLTLNTGGRMVRRNGPNRRRCFGGPLAALGGRA